MIERDGIILDGAGYTLHGSGDSSGIWLKERNGVTIKHLIIQNFGNGIRFGSNTVNCTVESCTFTLNQDGLSFSSISNCTILGNYAVKNTFGVVFTGSGNTFRNNTIEDNQYSFWDLSFSTLYHDYGENNVETSNTIDGKPIFYLMT